MEIGIVELAPKSAGAKEECLRLVGEMLQDMEDQAVVRSLDREEDRKERAGIIFEVTPAHAKGSFGAWWISVYDVAQLAASRVPPKELDQITTREGVAPLEDDPGEWALRSFKEARSAPRSSTSASNSGGSKTVYVRGYYRKNGTYVRPHRRSRPRR